VIAPPPSRPIVKGTSIASLASTSNVHLRQWCTRSENDGTDANVVSHQIKPPSTVNGVSRPTSISSTASRQIPPSNFSVSMGPGSRPPVSSVGRPPSSMGFNQSINGRQRVNARSRPATAMGDRGGDGDGGHAQQKNGTAHSLLFQTPTRKPQFKRVRGAVSLQSLSSYVPREGNADVSALNLDPDLNLDKQFKGLSLQDPKNDKPKGSQVISRPDNQVSAHPQLDAKSESAASRQSPQKEVSVLFNPPIVWPPKTPSRDQEIRRVFNKYEEALTACKTPSPFKPSSAVQPTKFLTKETSTLTNFTAWDVDERLHELDSQFKQMKEMMNVSLSDKKAMEDAVELAKTRGKLLTLDS